MPPASRSQIEAYEIHRGKGLEKRWYTIKYAVAASPQVGMMWKFGEWVITPASPSSFDHVSTLRDLQRLQSLTYVTTVAE
ncbi:hypothetical protein TNCV_629901 [Trichonephila clavipes]|nr:hypothetical protein TNCV_629901 [Trichonephila clavipes]